MDLIKPYIPCFKQKQKKKKTLILCNNITDLINLWDRIDTIFMNSEDSKVSNPHILLLNLLDKMNLKKSDKYVQILDFAIHEQFKKIM